MTQRIWLAVILSFYLLLGVGYSLAMPVWEAPDEMAHYRYALTVARERRLPTLEENYEGMQPPAYYMLAGGVLAALEEVRSGTIAVYAPPQTPENATRPLPLFQWDGDNYEPGRLLGPLLLRWLGIATGAGALLLIFRGARTLFPDWPTIALSTTALVAGTPQFLHITASVSNDVLAIIAGGFLFWSLAVVARPPPAPGKPSWILLGGAAICALLLPLVIKLTVLPASIGVLATVGWRGWARLQQEGAGGRELLRLAALLPIAAVPVSIFLFATSPGQHLLAEFRWRLLFFRPGFWEPLEIAERTAQTYWGYVGWVAVRLPDPWLLLVVALALVGAASSLRWLFRGEAGERRSWRLIWLTVLAAALIFTRNAFTTTTYQGRFLFPAIGPLSLLAIGGWVTLLPERGRSLLVPAVLLLTFALNLVLWTTGILPVYYQPLLD